MSPDIEAAETDPGWLHDDESSLEPEDDGPPASPEDAKTWIPYTGPRGGEGWQNTETGDVEYSDEPPGVTVGDDPAENPVEEGNAVMLEYDGERHYGKVVAESKNGESVRVKDDRNVWSLEPDATEQYGGDMRMWNLGDPEGGAEDPATMDINTPDELAYVLDELEYEEAVDRIHGSLDDLSNDEVLEAVSESGQSEMLIGSELMRRHGSAEVAGHTVSASPDIDETLELFNDWADRNPEAADTHRDAARGWEGAMYRARNAAPMIQRAIEDTGNDTLPEYDEADRATAQSVGEEALEHMEESKRFTQETLREAYGDEVTVFRGFSKNPHGGTGSAGTPAPAKMRAAQVSSIDELESDDDLFVDTGDGPEYARFVERTPDGFVAEVGPPRTPDPEQLAKDRDTVELPEEALVTDEEVEIEHRPAESWSLEPKTADLYAGQEGAVAQTTVPVEEVLASSSAGTIHPSENDTVLEHDGPRAYSPDEITTAEEASTDEGKLRLRLDAVRGMKKDD